MRILLLTDADAFAGTERHMLDLAMALRDVGALPTLSCPRGAPLEQRGARQGLVNFPIEKGGLLDLRAIQALRRALKRGQFEVLHAHNGRTHLSAALATTLARRGVCVFTQHFIEPGHTQQSGPRSAIFQRVHHFINARTQRFIAISEAVRAAMIERSDAPPEKVIVVPNGIGDPLQTTLASREVTRQKWGVASDAPLVVCAARLEAEKDHATLLQAFTELHQSWPTARLLLAGEGALQGQLQRQIEAQQLGEAARLVGFVEDMFSLLRAADVFVLPSPCEPFGLVFLEAMALSKPVVACAAGAAPEIVVPKQTGLLVAPHSPDAMRGAIETLLAKPQTAHDMGERGRQRYLSHFTRQLMGERMQAVYQEASQSVQWGPQ